MRRNGEKALYELKRQVIVRRPDQLWFHAMGADDRDFVGTYDGHRVTLVGAKEKVYATFEARPTIDATIDLVETRYDLPVPMADLLVANPYDALADPRATGGWVATESIDARSCEKASYQLEPVDYSLWVSADTPRVPCRLEVTFKARPGAPTTRRQRLQARRCRRLVAVHKGRWLEHCRPVDGAVARFREISGIAATRRHVASRAARRGGAASPERCGR